MKKCDRCFWSNCSCGDFMFFLAKQRKTKNLEILKQKCYYIIYEYVTDHCGLDFFHSESCFEIMDEWSDNIHSKDKILYNIRLSGVAWVAFPVMLVFLISELYWGLAIVALTTLVVYLWQRLRAKSARRKMFSRIATIIRHENFNYQYEILEKKEHVSLFGPCWTDVVKLKTTKDNKVWQVGDHYCDGMKIIQIRQNGIYVDVTISDNKIQIIHRLDPNNESNPHNYHIQ